MGGGGGGKLYRSERSVRAVTYRAIASIATCQYSVSLQIQHCNSVSVKGANYPEWFCLAISGRKFSEHSI